MQLSEIAAKSDEEIIGGGFAHEASSVVLDEGIKTLRSVLEPNATGKFDSAMAAERFKQFDHHRICAALTVIDIIVENRTPLRVAAMKSAVQA